MVNAMQFRGGTRVIDVIVANHCAKMERPRPPAEGASVFAWRN